MQLHLHCILSSSTTYPPPSFLPVESTYPVFTLPSWFPPTLFVLFYFLTLTTLIQSIFCSTSHSQVPLLTLSFLSFAYSTSCLSLSDTYRDWALAMSTKRLKSTSAPTGTSGPYWPLCVTWYLDEGAVKKCFMQYFYYLFWAQTKNKISDYVFICLSNQFSLCNYFSSIYFLSMFLAFNVLHLFNSISLFNTTSIRSTKRI